MFDWFRKRGPTSRLGTLLQDYPPFTPLHLGYNIRVKGRDGPVLTKEQLAENAAQYVAVIPDRIEMLRPVLSGIGIDLNQAYNDPYGYVTALHRTLLVELRPLYREERARGPQYELSDRAGKDIALSFMGDLAMLEIDVLRIAKPGCFVGQNLDPGDRNMGTYRRPCLLGLRDSLFGMPPQIFYPDGEYCGAYLNMDRPGRFAHPDVDMRSQPVDAIGGWLLIRLERYEVHPDIEDLKASTWLGKAAPPNAAKK